MKAIKIFTLLVISFVLFNACEKDNFGAPPFDPNKPVFFSTDVLPMLVTECAKAGCHVGGGPAPDLTTGNAYDQLTGLGYVPTDGTNAEACKLYVRMTSTSAPMPKTGVLPQSKTNLILGWIKQGAQNN